MCRMSEWLDSCFDRNDDRAPVRAFVFGAAICLTATLISSIIVDPWDWQVHACSAAGSLLIGGGCGAMFALPSHRFGLLCLFSFEVFCIVPMGALLDMNPFYYVVGSTSFFVCITASSASILVIFRVVQPTISWLFGLVVNRFRLNSKQP